jgi:hypothetical protein
MDEMKDVEIKRDAFIERRDEFKAKAESPIPTEPARPDVPNINIVELEKKMNEAFARLQECNQSKARWDAFQERQTKIKGLTDELEKAEKAHKYLDALKECLGPSGFRAQVMESKVSSMIDEVNNGLKGFAPLLVLDQAAWQWSAQVRGRVIPIKDASTSQILRMSCALQVALAKRSGINVVSVDSAESVDYITLRRFLEYLKTTGCQCFVTLVRDTPDSLGIDGITEWWVRRGEVRDLQEVLGEIDIDKAVLGV